MSIKYHYFCFKISRKTLMNKRNVDAIKVLNMNKLNIVKFVNNLKKYRKFVILNNLIRF